MTRRVKIIANPISGRGKALRLVPRIIERLLKFDCHIDYCLTKARGDARRFAADAADYDAVVCAGGDGTVNEALNGLPEKNAPPLAMIPLGTANVLAKELGLPRDPVGLARVIARGEPRPWDLGVERSSGHKFALMASAGFDSFIVDRFLSNRKGPIRMSQYVEWGLYSLPSFRPAPIRVEVDGLLVEPRASWVLVANCAAYGGPLRFARDARPDDGLFDVMIQRALKPRDAMRLMWSGLVQELSGDPYRMVDMRTVRGRRVVLSSDERIPLQMDGEPWGELPVEIELLPAAARMLT